jgi:hypothetical protein
MSLRAFDKSGSGRRTGNVSCENTNLAGGSSNFCCRRLELCLVSAVASRRHRAEYDAAGTLEGVRRASLSADRLERPGTGAAGRGTFHLCNRAIRTSTILDDAVSDLIGLHIEMATVIGHAHFLRHTHVPRHTHFLRHAYFSFFKITIASPHSGSNAT